MRSFARAMMTTRIPEIVIGAGAATACWAIISIAIGDAGSVAVSDAGQAQAVAAKQMVWLTVVQILVAAAGLAGLFLTLRQTQRTADAGINAAVSAQRSVDASIALQLPIIRVTPSILSFGSRQNMDEPRQDYCIVDSVVLSNLGRTQAFPIELRCGWTVGERLPTSPSYPAVSPFLLNFILQPDPKTTPKKNIHDLVEILLEPGVAQLIHDGQTTLWFYCSLVFDDFMQVRHEQRFCWRWEEYRGNGLFRSDSTPAYNLKT